MTLLPGVLEIHESAHMYTKSAGVRSWGLSLPRLAEHWQLGSPSSPSLLSPPPTCFFSFDGKSLFPGYVHAI